MKTQAETGVMWSQAKECGQPPKLEEARNGFSPRASALGGAQLCLHHDFGLLAFRAVRINFRHLKPPRLGNLSQQPRETNGVV